MRRNKNAESQSFETAPKDGTELIIWLSSQKEFQDTTANFYFADGRWWWADTEEVLSVPTWSTDGCGIHSRPLLPGRHHDDRSRNRDQA